MIDDKKIEEAKDNIFNKHFLKNNEGMIYIDHISEPVYLDYQIKQALELGAKWAINQYLEDLWHSSEEVPEIGRVIIMENYYPDGRIMFISRMRKSTFHNPIDIGNTKKWFYIEDLFSKEGGNHD